MTPLPLPPLSLLFSCPLSTTSSLWTGNDNLVREAWDKIGDYYADRFKWKKAAQYYQQSRNLEQLAECHYRLENFSELSKLRMDLPDDSPLLVSLAKRFESVGMIDEAVDCYLRSSR